MFIIIFVFPTVIYSQQLQVDTSNPDSMFLVAKEYAHNHELELCRKICFSVLKDYPDYIDFSVLASRTLAWENNFDSARSVIAPILITKPYNKEILLTLADIELWQEKFEEALSFVDTGLVAMPSDTQLIDKRIEILNKMDSLSSASSITNVALYSDSNAIGISYYFDFFKKPYMARRHMVSLQYTKITKFAPITGRFNIGDNVLNGEHIFETPSYQVELDAYPKLDEKSYLYINYGIGSSSFFPTHKAGIEYFKALNSDFEFSIGSRYMYWGNSIFFLTGSISKYLNTYWLSFRPFLSLKSKIFADAYLLEARRYFGPFNSYLFGLIIFGDSPDQPLSLAQESGNFRSIKYAFGLQHRIKQIQFNSGFGIQREEYRASKIRTRLEYRIGVNYVF